jgi:LysM repeat protein
MSKNRIFVLILSTLLLVVLATSALAQDAATRTIIARLRAVDLAMGRIVVADRVVNVTGAQIVADSNGLQRGDYVQLVLTSAADGSVIVQSVTEIAAQNPTVSGVVQAFDASTVTINGTPYSLTHAIVDREGTLTVGQPARIEFIEFNGQRLALEVEFDDDNSSNNTSNNSSNNTSNNTSNNSSNNSGANCEPPANWYRYILRFGDTLSALAVATGTSVEDLMFANCITDPRGLLAGQFIFIPLTNISTEQLNQILQNNRPGSDRWDDLFDDRWDDDDDDNDDDFDDRWDDDDDDDDWDDDDDDDWNDDNDDDDWDDDDDDGGDDDDD